MKHFGICFATRFSRWEVGFVDAASEQGALAKFCYLHATADKPLCIHHIVEWKGKPNGQYILTVA